MDITEKTDVELKALAYDELAKVEMAQRNIQAINQELAKRGGEVVEEGAKEEEKTDK